MPPSPPLPIRRSRTPAADRLPGFPGAEHWRREERSGLHYVDHGSGDVVLMLHGNPTWGYLWRRLIAALAGDFRCIVPDQLGMGLSQRRAGAGPIPLAQRLEHLDALAAHLIEQRRAPSAGWTLAVHDWGGPIGLAWARRHPGLVAKLVVLNSVGFRWPEGYRLPRSLALLRDVRPLGAAAHLLNVFPRAALRAGVVRPLPAEVRSAYLRPYRSAWQRRAVRDFLRQIPRSGADPAWSLVDPGGDSAELAGLPVFIGWGLRDPVFTPLVLREWRRRLPHAEVHAFADAGHFVLEDAGESLTGPLRRFLSTR
ncbi:alpha/beta fold hydrolase [Kitasatospora sp. NPDC098663]|uniref:alpha/beta fold hydrolase n=1 Tax=Kitasatospora sp. NPDC098663 TaxID=3364096 RepID=UPI003817866B